MLRQTLPNCANPRLNTKLLRTIITSLFQIYHVYRYIGPTSRFFLKQTTQ